MRFGPTVRRANDEFVKSLVAEMEVGAFAYRQAKAEGYKGEELSRRIDELVGDMQSKAWDKAVAEAQRITFQTELSKREKALGEFIQQPIGSTGLRPGSFIVPFYKTLWNIFKTGVRMSPFGAPKAAWSLAKGQEDGVQRLAEQLLGAAIIAAIWSMGDDDDWITGAEGMSTEVGRDLAWRTNPPASIKGVQYGRMEPFGTVLPLLLDGVRALKRGDEKAVSGIADSIAGQLENKTFAQGLAKVARLIQSHDVASLGRFAGDVAGQFYPAAAKAAKRSTLDTMRETKAWGQGDEKYKMMGKRFVERTLELKGTPDVDLWGREKKQPLGTWAERMVTPFSRRDTEITVGDRLLLAWNKTADKPYLPQSPEPYITVKGKKHYLTERQYHDFQVDAGREADREVQRQLGDVRQPSADDIETLKKIIADARDRIRKQNRAEWTGESGFRLR